MCNNKEGLSISLLNYISTNNHIFHVVSKDVSEITGSLIDYIWDIGIKGRRSDEDKLFEKNRELRNIVRRGFSLGIKISPLKKKDYENIRWFEYDVEYLNVWILRRGFQKFSDLSFLPQERERQLKYSVKGDYSRLSFLATEKLDGENSQISYFEPTDQWIIGSKNVTLLCKNKQELKSKFYNEKRYISAKNIGLEWFRLLEGLLDETGCNYENELSQIKKILTDNTLLAELICVNDRQHVIDYQYREEKMKFIGLISKNSQNQVCHSPSMLYEFLPSYFRNNIVNFVRLPSQRVIADYLESNIGTNKVIERGVFDSSFFEKFNFSSLGEINDYLSVLYFVVYFYEEEIEGIMLYIIREEERNMVVLDAFKVKTVIYSTLRSLREKLKHILTLDFKILLKDDKRNLINQPDLDDSLKTEILKQYWKPIYNFLFLRLPISSELFIRNLNKANAKILSQYKKNEYEAIKEKVTTYLVNFVQKYKIFFQDSAIYLSSFIVFIHLNSKGKLDFTEAGRNFFDHYINFISQVNQQESILPAAPTTGPICPNLSNDFLSNTTVELTLPPFILTWEEIKYYISMDLSISQEVLILCEDQCFLTGSGNSTNANSGVEFDSSKIKDNNKIYVNIRHNRNTGDSFVDDPSVLNYKLSYEVVKEDSSTTCNEEEVNSTQVRYVRSSISVMACKFDRIYNAMSDFLDEINMKIDREVEKEGTQEEISTHNKRVIFRLQNFSRYLPWKKESSNVFSSLPKGYVLNKKDFEHLAYSLVALEDIDYVLKAFYYYGVEEDLLKIKDSLLPVENEDENKLECTVVLLSGLPGSGKSSILRNYLKDKSLEEDCSYCETFLTSGEFENKINPNGEMVYSIMVNSEKKRNTEFDIIFYVSSDGCINRVFKGDKWNNHSVNFMNSDKSLNKGQYDDLICNRGGEGFDIYGPKKWMKELKAGNDSMKFIVNYVIKQCLYLTNGITNENGKKILKTGIISKLLENIDHAPKWLRELFGAYQGDKNLKMLLLIDKNNTTKNIVELNKNFGILFNIDSGILYRVILLTTQTLTRAFGDSGLKERDWHYVWSKDDVMRCIIRLSKRIDHSTLSGLTIRSLVVLLSFLKVYSTPIKVASGCKDKSTFKNLKLHLSQELVENLGFDGFISLQNDKDFSFDNLDPDVQILLDDIYNRIEEIISSIKPFDIESKDNTLTELLIRLNNLLSMLKINEENGLKEVVKEFSENLSKIVKETKPKIHHSENHINYLENESLNLEINKSGYFSQSQIRKYVSEIRSKFNLTAITFEENKESEHKILELWSKNKTQFSDLLNEIININGHSTRNNTERKIELPEISKSKKHISCHFFSQKDNYTGKNLKNRQHCEKYADNSASEIETEFDKERISDLAVAISKPYMGKIYSFQGTYLVYIHPWKLAFLAVNSKSKLLQIISNEKKYDLSVKIDGKNESKSSGNKRNKNAKLVDGETKFTHFNYKDFKSAFPLPIRQYGNLHITLFSHVFKPVISNIGIGILKENFTNENSIKHRDGIYQVNARVNEEPLRELLISEQESKNNYVISSDKKLEILVKNIWNQELDITGMLNYM
ncbi:hypothetical protein FG386_003268 [Cryptosporidium ryanae]|uniref:uncharacterized protein n=1 Tax=Cryptosporidium ryanae TaxID=515981 RepID=UPI00351A8145|nr:hypothetical protein FG386_003268 [Cryptosporidium ryanae]